MADQPTADPPMLFPPTEREQAIRDVVAHTQAIATERCAQARCSYECGHDTAGDDACDGCPLHYVELVQAAGWRTLRRELANGR